ncbi:uncharacterized protein BO80DRAFT_480872 [Aspergillus ibericus CBS 121593]|uniref:Uncharacterized protein n=1 Tax=Aspergillus ibericus CBS 121593 TaxID=1448316 RepID=A0A395HD57_9EURO|nr:hypothetical protein BO80DRAFT_480872 [Aspergillus ibericus CBS 121593]RAL04918.1 hypothetical protein BO80DRAFT_480872 [Aspergillus ibericus CBS 121593]
MGKHSFLKSRILGKTQPSQFVSNSLRMNIYPEYYFGRQDNSSDMAAHQRHLDHCVDILRQALMCTADINIVTMNWLKCLWRSLLPDIHPLITDDGYELGRELPTPNFNTRHVCRNFDRILEWNDRHGRVNYSLHKSGTEFALDEFP